MIQKTDAATTGLMGNASPSSPTTSSRESYWFSRRAAPSGSIRLSTGEPIAKELIALVKQALSEATSVLQPGKFYTARQLFGDCRWKGLNDGDRRRVGRCLADFARQPDSPVGLLEHKGNPHHYFLRTTRDTDSSINLEGSAQCPSCN